MIVSGGRRLKIGCASRRGELDGRARAVFATTKYGPAERPCRHLSPRFLGILRVLGGMFSLLPVSDADMVSRGPECALARDYATGAIIRNGYHLLAPTARRVILYFVKELSRERTNRRMHKENMHSERKPEFQRFQSEVDRRVSR